MSNLLERTRQIIEASPVTRYQIAKDTGIDQTTLSLFVNGKRGLSIERVEIVLDYLGYEIEIVKREGTKER